MNTIDELTSEELVSIDGGSFWSAIQNAFLAVLVAADWVYDMTDDFKNNDSRSIF